MLRKEWRTSSRSGEGSACVEARAADDGAQVRDSKDPTGPVLDFDPRAWRAFIAAIRGGDFDQD